MMTKKFRLRRGAGFYYVLSVDNIMDSLVHVDYRKYELSMEEAKALADVLYPLSTAASKTQPFDDVERRLKHLEEWKDLVTGR